MMNSFRKISNSEMVIFNRKKSESDYRNRIKNTIIISIPNQDDLVLVLPQNEGMPQNEMVELFLKATKENYTKPGHKTSVLDFKIWILFPFLSIDSVKYLSKEDIETLQKSNEEDASLNLTIKDYYEEIRTKFNNKIHRKEIETKSELFALSDLEDSDFEIGLYKNQMCHDMSFDAIECQSVLSVFFENGAVINNKVEFERLTDLIYSLANPEVVFGFVNENNKYGRQEMLVVKNKKEVVFDCYYFNKTLSRQRVNEGSKLHSMLSQALRKKKEELLNEKELDSQKHLFIFKNKNQMQYELITKSESIFIERFNKMERLGYLLIKDFSGDRRQALELILKNESENRNMFSGVLEIIFNNEFVKKGTKTIVRLNNDLFLLNNPSATKDFEIKSHSVIESLVLQDQGEDKSYGYVFIDNEILLSKNNGRARISPRIMDISNLTEN